MQPRQGRQKTTPSPVSHINDLDTNSKNLPSLTGLIGSADLTPTVKTVGNYRVSLPRQKTGEPEMRPPC